MPSKHSRTTRHRSSWPPPTPSPRRSRTTTRRSTRSTAWTPRWWSTTVTRTRTRTSSTTTWTTTVWTRTTWTRTAWTRTTSPPGTSRPTPAAERPAHPSAALRVSEPGCGDLLQHLPDLLRQLQVVSGERATQLSRRSRPDDRAGHARGVPGPGQRHLHRRPAQPVGCGGHRFHHRPGLVVQVRFHETAQVRGGGPGDRGHRATVLAGQQAAAQRLPRQDAHAQRVCRR